MKNVQLNMEGAWSSMACPISWAKSASFEAHGRPGENEAQSMTAFTSSVSVGQATAAH